MAIDGGLQSGKRWGCRVGAWGVAGWQEMGLQGGRRLVNDLDYGVGRSRGSVLWPGDQ